MFKITARVQGIKEPFVDHYKAETKKEAHDLWKKDAIKYGVQISKATILIEPVK